MDKQWQVSRVGTDAQGRAVIELLRPHEMGGVERMLVATDIVSMTRLAQTGVAVGHALK